MSKKNSNIKTAQATSSSVKEVLLEHRLILFILFAAGILRFWHINWGLPQVYEEAIPLRFGMKLWDMNKNPIDYNFFVYPALTYYIQFVVQAFHFLFGYVSGSYQSLQAFLKMYEVNPTTFVILGRSVTSIFDLGTIAITYIVLNKFADKKAALIASFLISINILHITEAHVINVDTALTFFAVLLLFSLFKLYDQPIRKWYIISGIIVGLLASTKYNGAVLILGIVVVHCLTSSSVRSAILSLKNASLLLSVLVSGLVFVLVNPLILTHVEDFLVKFHSTELHMEAGSLGIDYSKSTLGYYVLDSLPSNLGWVLLIVVGVSFCYFLFSRQKKNYVLLTVPTIFLVLLSMWQTRADRYIFPLIPFFIMIGSLGIVRFYDYVKVHIKNDIISMLIATKVYSTSLGLLAVLIAAIPMFGSVVNYHRALSLPDTRTIGKQWIEKNLSTGAAIASGPFGIELLNTKFITLPIQFSAVNSEQMAPFYDTRWYEDIDLLVASDYDYGRYKQNPERYHEMLSFYDSLRSRWKLVYEITPNEGQTGPTIWFYQFKGLTADSLFDPDLIHNLTSSTRLEDERKVSFLGKLGIILSLKGKSQKSGQVLQEMQAIDPNNVEVREILAQISMIQKANIKKLSPSLPSNKSDVEDVKGLVARAGELYKEGNLDESEKYYLAALKIDNHSDDSYQGLMLIYGSRNEVEKVIDILTKYLSILPPNSRNYKLVAQQIEGLKKGKVRQ